jgi:hypothetical protein
MHSGLGHDSSTLKALRVKKVKERERERERQVIVCEN